MDPLVYKAKIYATAAHAAVGQFRDYSGLPYIVHPEEVSNILASAGCGVALQAAGYLHDVVEDTAITIAILENEFGCEVADLVRMATNISKPEDGNRKVRAAINLRHKTGASADGQSLILSDIISNIRTLVHLNPKFAKVYVPEKWEVVKAMVLGNAELWDMARDVNFEAAQALKINLV